MVLYGIVWYVTVWFGMAWESISDVSSPTALFQRKISYDTKGYSLPKNYNELNKIIYTYIEYLINFLLLPSYDRTSVKTNFKIL